MVKKLLFRVAKAPLMGKLVGAAFQYCAWAIPVKKVHCSREILAFEHPQPAYPNHVIISPRKPVQTLLHMASEDTAGYFIKVWEAVKVIGVELPAYHDELILVANGGKRQEVQQVHFHMFTNHEMVEEYDVQTQAGNVVFRDDAVCVVEHPQPQWACHLVIRPALQPPAGDKKRQDEYFKGVLRCIGALDSRYDIVQKGYSLVYQQKKKNDMEYPVFHIAAGKRLK